MGFVYRVILVLKVKEKWPFYMELSGNRKTVFRGRISRDIYILVVKRLINTINALNKEKLNSISYIEDHNEIATCAKLV